MAEVLDLDVLTERNVVKINGTPYELRDLQELTLVDYLRMERKGRRLEELKGLDTDESVVEYAEVLATICRAVIIAPADVVDALPQLAQQKVALFFFAHAGNRTPAVKPPPPAELVPSVAPTSSGESSSQG